MFKNNHGINIKVASNMTIYNIIKRRFCVEKLIYLTLDIYAIIYFLSFGLLMPANAIFVPGTNF